MERHNNYLKFDQYSKVIALSYAVGGLAIVLLPFLTTASGVNFLGYDSPYTYVFMGFSVLGLFLFGWRYTAIDSGKDRADFKPVPIIYPAVVAVIALIIFKTGGQFFVNAYVKSGKQDMLSKAVCGQPSKLAFWWGPFIYCMSLTVAAYYSLLVNKVIKELREGIL